jgi:hypothetical protein
LRILDLTIPPSLVARADQVMDQSAITPRPRGPALHGNSARAADAEAGASTATTATASTRTTKATLMIPPYTPVRAECCERISDRVTHERGAHRRSMKMALSWDAADWLTSSSLGTVSPRLSMTWEPFGTPHCCP